MALLLAGLLILKIISIELITHLLFEDGMEFISYFTDSCFSEEYHGLLFGHLIDTSQLFLWHWYAVGELFVEALLENLECVAHGILAFVPANIGP